MNELPNPLAIEPVYLTDTAYTAARASGIRIIRPDLETVANINQAVAGEYPGFALPEENINQEQAFIIRWLSSGIRRLKWDARYHTATPDTEYVPSINLSSVADTLPNRVPKHALHDRSVVEMSWKDWDETKTGERLASALLYPPTEPSVGGTGHQPKDVGANVISTLLTSKSDEDRKRQLLIKDVARQFPVAFSVSR
jgi:hypothetical protein